MRKNVSGERDNVVLPATPFLAVIGGVSSQFDLQGLLQYHGAQVLAISCPLF